MQCTAAIGKDGELGTVTDVAAPFPTQVTVGHQLGDDLKCAGLLEVRPGHHGVEPGASDAGLLVGIVRDRHQGELLGRRQIGVGCALQQVDRHQRRTPWRVSQGVCLHTSRSSGLTKLSPA
jgi:hypothetical protein